MWSEFANKASLGDVPFEEVKSGDSEGGDYLTSFID